MAGQAPQEIQHLLHCNPCIESRVQAELGHLTCRARWPMNHQGSTVLKERATQMPMGSRMPLQEVAGFDGVPPHHRESH